MEGVEKLVPVPKELPPVELAYQLIVPPEAAAPNVTVPVPHLDPGVELIIEGALLIEMSEPLSVPIIEGELLITRIRYPVPVDMPCGRVAEIVPADVEVIVPMEVGEEKLPLEFES